MVNEVAVGAPIAECARTDLETLQHYMRGIDMGTKLHHP